MSMENYGKFKNYTVDPTNRTKRNTHRGVFTQELPEGSPEKMERYIQQLLYKYPWMDAALDEAVKARAEFMDRVEGGEKISNPVYRLMADEQGLPTFKIASADTLDNDGDTFTNVRDILDMLYYNLAYDADAKPRYDDLDVSAIYDEANRRLGKLLETTVENPETGVVSAKYPHALRYGAKWMQSRNPLRPETQFSEPNTIASILKLFAPRGTTLLADPEADQMLDAGNMDELAKAGVGDLGEWALSAYLKPFKALMSMGRSGERLAARLAPKAFARIANINSPKFAKMYDLFSKANNAATDFAVKHPSIASAARSGLGNMEIYSLAKGYDAVTDPNDYTNNAPFNALDMLFAGGFGAGVPLMGVGASKVMDNLDIMKNFNKDIKMAGLTGEERLRKALADSQTQHTMGAADIKPSSIPNQWLKDLRTNSKGEPTADWNQFLNADLERLQMLHPEMFYGFRRFPQSNIGSEVPGFVGVPVKNGSGVKLGKNETTRELEKQGVILDEHGAPQKAWGEGTGTFQKPSDTSVKQWKAGMKPSQRAVVETLTPDEQIAFSAANSVDKGPYQLMMQFPDRPGKVGTLTPKEYSRVASENFGTGFGKALSESIYAADKNGVPLAPSVNRKLKTALADRKGREAAVKDYMDKDRTNTPLREGGKLDKATSINPLSLVVMKSGQVGARTVGRNIPHFADAKNYTEDKEKDDDNKTDSK